MATQICEIQRRTDGEGRTLFFMIAARSRSRQHRFFEPDEVPPFDGPSAWFEVEARGGRQHWKVLRRVDVPNPT